MEAKIDQLTSSITSLVRQFLQTEVSEYRENYEYMLNSPLCRKLLTEIECLKKQNQEMNSSEKPNIELEIKENEDQEYIHNIDRQYKLNTGECENFDHQEAITLEVQNEEDSVTNNVQDESVIEDEVEDVHGPQHESGGEVEEVEVTDDESGGEVEEVEETDENGEEVEEVEGTDDESGGEEEEVEEVEVTDDESGEEVEVTDDESEEEDDEEDEEVFEFEHEGVMYFATNEENGILYACVDDDIGDEVGKIENKNVILY